MEQGLMAADNADVRSVDQLEIFLEDAKRYRVQLMKELENLEVEVRRLTNWIESEAPSYWQQELTRSQRQYREARDALTRCMSYVREDERKPCTEQKKRVKITKDRMVLCEEKLRTARSAASAWEREYRKNQGKFQRVRDLAETDLPVAINYLSGQLERLIEYSGLRSAAVRTSESFEHRSETKVSGKDIASEGTNEKNQP